MYVCPPFRTYCRSFSKPVSGDGVGVGDAAGVALLLEVLVGALSPPHAPKNKITTSKTQPNLLIARLSKRVLHKLLISDVHDGTFRILVNNIKPAACSRVIEKIVMLVV